MKKVVTKNKEETGRLAREVLGGLKDCNVILLQGELGAGKTTFAQELLRAVGAEGPFTSPTFVIMKRYKIGNHESEIKNIFHIDAYRVGADDVLEIGWEEIVANRKNLALVEWPERIKKIWPKEYLKIDFEVTGLNERKIRLENKK